MKNLLRYLKNDLTKKIQSSFFHYHTSAGILSLSLAITVLSGGFHPEVWAEVETLSREKVAKVTLPNGSVIMAEIADTPDKRARGLMYRTSLAPDRGMLFQFPELGYWTFWMKNTKIPLDILWLDNTGKIIHIESEVPICTRTDDHCPRFYSYQKSWQVLEIKAGMAKKHNLDPGDQLKISISQTQK